MTPAMMIMFKGTPIQDDTKKNRLVVISRDPTDNDYWGGPPFVGNDLRALRPRGSAGFGDVVHCEEPCTCVCACACVRV